MRSPLLVAPDGQYDRRDLPRDRQLGLVTLLAGTAAACAEPVAPPEAKRSLPSGPALAPGCAPADTPTACPGPSIGSSIAFYSNRVGPQQFDIHMMDNNGSWVTHITGDPSFFDWQPALSPSGDEIAFTRSELGPSYTHDIYVLATNGSEVEGWVGGAGTAFMEGGLARALALSRSRPYLQPSATDLRTDARRARDHKAVGSIPRG